MPSQRIERTRRDALLDAALTLFDARGYGATTMTAIQQATGASTGSLYHHFPSKAHLAAALQERALADYQYGFVRILEEHPDDAEAGVRATVAYHLGWVSEHLGQARLLYTLHDPDVSELAAPRLAVLNKDFFDRVHAWYTRQADRNRVRVFPFDVLACVWIGPAQEMARSSLTSDIAPERIIRHRELLSSAAWNALCMPR